MATFDRLLASLARSGHIRQVAGLFKQVSLHNVFITIAGEIRTCTTNVYNIIGNERIHGVLSGNLVYYTLAKHYIYEATSVFAVRLHDKHSFVRSRALIDSFHCTHSTNV